MQCVLVGVRGGVVAVLVWAALGLGAGGAGADEPRDANREESRAAFLRGVNEAHQEHFTAARDAFLEAYRLFPHPSILLNLGVARLRTGEYVAAEENLGRFLVDDGGATPDDLANARAALAVARRHLGTLRVRVSPPDATATLDGAPLTLTPSAFLDVRAVVGPAQIKVTANGCVPVTRDVTVGRDQVVLADIVLSPSAPGSPDGPRGTPFASDRHALVGFGLLGAGGLFALVGTVAGVEAISLAHDFNTPGSGHYQEPSTRGEGIAWRTSADVLLGTALVTAGVGAYILLRPLPRAADVHVTVGPTAATISYRF